MNIKTIVSGLLALCLSAITACAWSVSGVVSCPNGSSASNIVVFITGIGSTTTSGNGAYFIALPVQNATYTVCVDPSTLPPGATIATPCATFSVDFNNQFANVDFTLSGTFCETPPPQGPCWLTGGGTIGRITGTRTPIFSFGGVVNPGCSPTAAGGGNWNVIDRVHNLHFQGQDITVTACSGVATESPRVTVNIIDFTGTGILVGIRGNSQPKTPVCFTARAVDVSEPGHDRDSLYLNVTDCLTGATLLVISSQPATPSVVAPSILGTGNLQIHQSGCDK